MDFILARIDGRGRTARRLSRVSALAVVLLCGRAAWLRAAAGEGPPGSLDLQVFAPGRISTSAIERAVAFLGDGRTVLFDRRGGRWGDEPEPSRLYLSDLRAGVWQPARLAPCSGRFNDTDPFVSPDGRRVVFTSDRPTPAGQDAGRDLWLVEIADAGWSEPRHLAPPVGSPDLEMGASLAADGTLYFASNRDGGHGSGDLYRARRVRGGYPRVENLGPVVNGPSGEWDVGVSPDQSFIVFESSGRPGAKGPGGDLYLSYRRDDSWTRPLHLDAISTPGSDLMPRVSPDGSRLFFASSRTADGSQTDVFSVSLAALLALYPPPAP